MMWSARLRRHVHARRAQRRVASLRVARRGPVDASDWLRVELHGVEMTVAAPDPSLRRFWEKATAGAWEREAFDYLDDALSAAGPSPLFVDVGAWVGPITLFAAGRGAKVLALEPDPAARAELTANLAANPALQERVTIVAAALDDRARPLALYPHSERFGASKTSSLPDPSGMAVVAQTLSAEALIHRAGRVGTRTGAVVNADMEGHEFSICAELARLVRGLGASALISAHPRALYEATRLRSEAGASPHVAAFDGVRRLIGAFQAAGIEARPLERAAADPLVYAGAQVFRRGARPRNFDLAVRARPAPEAVRD